ncbi:hypothetical protein AVEN_149553-1 [Araneus ventricosus]|uniref:Uncharacterized protein n=1 Tax=Araneus ventricosus TaxID=182803 RepID=A0A4Y2U9V3_ARAVE|nr:hypothetical protein AVEN_88326-1 [Araneus ventricosus]GBO06162.1 hypothetical protein AVEN_1783-1 [Araneus ventricosus]GBO08852.1 hypothetical protein AVEN_45740-1 [Araneus ventricosus]GBO08854.1 hypothetical protein AVEN_149553-1 [Araneus ventricosus]
MNGNGELLDILSKYKHFSSGISMIRSTSRLKLLKGYFGTCLIELNSQRLDNEDNILTVTLLSKFSEHTNGTFDSDGFNKHTADLRWNCYSNLLPSGPESEILIPFH